MEFIFGKQDFKDMKCGQENCYLLTDGRGGYSSLTMVGSCARNDHALWMAAVSAPTKRYHLLSRMEEVLIIDGRHHRLSSQEYVTHTQNETGYRYLNAFSKDIFPVWHYQAEGVELIKTIVVKNGESTIGIRYTVRNHMQCEVQLRCTPWMQFALKGEKPKEGQKFETTGHSITSGGIKVYYKTDGSCTCYDTRWQEDYYYAHDARDGRPATGRGASTHDLGFTVFAGTEESFFIIYSLYPVTDTIGTLFKEEEERQHSLVQRAGIRHPIGQQLVRSGDCFLADRESTGEKTILAGYPFFSDWGRDTMIAVSGLGINSGRYEETKSIFRSFLRYLKNGLMPNMFPESGGKPFYNTVDASLLFLLSVYEYYGKSGDHTFIKDIWDPLCEIISWYEKGTDFHIRMDSDGLLLAGAELEQVTWMDVRFGDILPTPRHGKPVEINAWWYNALRIMGELGRALKKGTDHFTELAERVRGSFQEKFWNSETGCLKDVVSGEAYDAQIRCNQIWAVSAPFAVLTQEQENRVVERVFEKLYTPCGLRTLDPEDPQFHAVYKGSQFQRDMAYHQGTVWPFPLGAYYLAYLKVHGYSGSAKEVVRQQLKPLEACLREGCIGQVPEVYDGAMPSQSKGCFAQAWSVGELLKVYAALEMESMEKTGGKENGLRGGLS